ncbi:PdaC/SigV domain-containing protein [Paenibacillus sp. NPDC056933]|uniref:PdaC/SigV domain-containing protein n=1 Tax=Paenibacillus sp. NPDC056933 TaxID=3345968 RepID=UPI00362CE514
MHTNIMTKTIIMKNRRTIFLAAAIMSLSTNLPASAAETAYAAGQASSPAVGVTSISLASSAVPYGLEATTLSVDGKKLDVLAYHADNTLMVQLVPVAKVMGYTVDYNAKTGDLTLKKLRRVIKMALNYSEYNLNGMTSSAKTPFIRGNSTYLPLRQLADLSGYTIVQQGRAEYKLTARPENDVTISASEELSVATEPYSFSFHYPVLSGYANKEAMDNINQFLKETAEKWKTEAEQVLSEAWAVHPDKDRIIDYAHMYPYGFQAQWKVAYNQEGLLSLYADTYQYMGGTEPDRLLRHSWTFDLNTGQPLTLLEASGNLPDCATKINQYVNLKIASGEVNSTPPAQFPGIETAGTGWYVQDGKIIVYVQPEPVAFLKNEIFEISVPISRIAGAEQ